MRTGLRVYTPLRSKLAEPRYFLVPRAQRLDDVEKELVERTNRSLRACDERVRAALRRLEARDPSRRLADRGRRLQAAVSRLEALEATGAVRMRARSATVVERLARAARARQQASARRFEVLQTRLNGNDPEAILQRGYAIVIHRGSIVRDADALSAGEPVQARLARGTLYARVERKETDGNERIG